MDIEWLRILAFAFVFGLLLGSGWIAAYLASWVGSWIWAWVDDSEAPKKNPLITRSMHLMGWGEGDWLWQYKKGEATSDGAVGFLFPMLALIATPPLIALSVALYPLTLSIALAFLTARLARFARRHKKLFDKHLKDPEAHK